VPTAELHYWLHDEQGEINWAGYVAMAITPYGEILFGGPKVDDQ
jgi:hypothetical protein